jgi:hypoxanthine phosphoribosyltransferase
MAAENLRLSDSADNYISSLDIAEHVTRLGEKFTRQYRDIEQPILVNVRKGAGAFAWDLARKIKHPDLLYKEVQTGTMDGMVGGDFTLAQDIDVDISGRHVLVCEDIMDRRVTLHALLALFRARNPASLSVAVMFEKPEAAQPGTEFDEPVSVGIRIANRFVVGYGLDYNEQYRLLPHVTTCIVPDVGEPYPEVALEPLAA